MLMALGLAALAGIAGFLGFAATRPGAFRIARTARIEAPPETIYPLVSDFHRWTEWSPWEEIDPGMQRTYSGAERGTGARYAWSGNRKAGEGSMHVAEATSPSHVTIDLQFTRPFKATNVTEFDLDPVDGGTEVTWAMTGVNALPAKVFGVFMDMDDLVGKDFEKGLAKLKAVAERPRVDTPA